MIDAPETTDSSEEPAPVGTSRPQIEVLLWRGVRLKCPRCGQGKMYLTYLHMNNRCPHCRLGFQRGPGYYLGATYINYGVTALTMTSLFLFLRLVLNIPTRSIIWPSFAVCIVIPLLIFRHSRGLWLAFDCQFDRSVLED